MTHRTRNTHGECACCALVREAVDYQDAHLGAIRHPEDRPDRLPHLDWEAWYARARAARHAEEGYCGP